MIAEAIKRIYELLGGKMINSDYVKRYIYDVTNRVPKNQREKVHNELEQLITEMCENNPTKVEEVLINLGDPSEYAKKYRDKNSFLIGYEYLYSYISVIKTALSCTILAAFLFSFLEAINNTFPFIYSNEDQYIDFFVKLFTRFFEYSIGGSLSIIGLVTIIFAIIQQHNAKINTGAIAVWSPARLEPVPDKRYRIDRNSCTLNITFAVVVSAIMVFSPQLLGTYLFEGNTKIKLIPFFNQEYWSYILPIMLLIFLTIIIDNLIRLKIGYYTKTVMYVSVILKIIQIILSAILLKAMSLFNQNFVREISASNNYPTFFGQDKWYRLSTEILPNIILLFIVIASLVELSYTIYKTKGYER